MCESIETSMLSCFTRMFTFTFKSLVSSRKGLLSCEKKNYAKLPSPVEKPLNRAQPRMNCNKSILAIIRSQILCKITLKVQGNWSRAKKVMIFLLQGTFVWNPKSLRHWPMQLRTYQYKFRLFIMLKLKQMIDLTCLTIIKSYIKPIQFNDS